MRVSALLKRSEPYYTLESGDEQQRAGDIGVFLFIF
jgi:hypothetical protein